MLAPGKDERTWRAGLQLVSRAGVVSEAELIEFRSAVETLAAKLGATLSAPEMRTALEGARELDKVCADSRHPGGVACHRAGDRARCAASSRSRSCGARTVSPWCSTSPSRRDLARSYEAMARCGRDLAASHGARLVDDRGNALDERALAAIGAQVEAVRQTPRRPRHRAPAARSRCACFHERRGEDQNPPPNHRAPQPAVLRRGRSGNHRRGVRRAVRRAAGAGSGASGAAHPGLAHAARRRRAAAAIRRSAAPHADAVDRQRLRRGGGARLRQARARRPSAPTPSNMPRSPSSTASRSAWCTATACSSRAPRAATAPRARM